MYDREEMLVKVATMFYENNYTQTQIANELGISRPTIANFLNEAKETGIVQIIISHPNKLTLHKEDQLQNLFPKTKIMIATQNSMNPKEAVGITTANLLSGLLIGKSTVGISWGTTISEVVHAFNYSKMENLTFYPLIGGIVSSDVKYHSNHLVSTFAHKVDGNAESIYAPALASSLEIKKIYDADPFISSTLEKAKNVDVAIVGIGNPLQNSNYQEHGILTKEEIELINNEGVVGDFITSFYNIQGEEVAQSITDRMIGLTIHDLDKIGAVIGLATGHEKVLSAYVALQKELVDYLIIDMVLADELLSYHESITL